MATPMRHRLYLITILGLATLIGLAAFGCGEKTKPSELVRQLTRHKEYRPPASASTDTAGNFPTLYVRLENDSLRGIINPNLLEPFKEVAEASPPNLIRQLRTIRQVLQERAGDSLRVGENANLVIDRNMNFGQIMGVIYLSNYGSFLIPHLITASGHEQLIEPPRIHRKYGPMGWSAWVWWMPDQSLKWLTVPDSTRDMSVHTLASEDGTANIPALVDSLHQALDNRGHIPPGPKRLIGIWAYNELSYPKLMEIVDAFRFPQEGPQLANRITFLQGANWGPPEPRPSQTPPGR